MILDEEDRQLFKAVFIAVAIAMFFVATAMFGCPYYNVWSAEMEGKAEAARAVGEAKAQKILRDSAFSAVCKERDDTMETP